MATNALPAHASKQVSESSLQRELKIQFFDVAWLSQHSLYSKEMAIEYFYSSPFYSEHRSDTLNELIRAGETVENEQDGLLFEVTYDNLDVILTGAPTTVDLRHVYINENSIFHIKLFRRKTGIHGMVSTPIKTYCIVQKKIYRLQSVAEIFNYRMFYATRFIEKCFDVIQSMSQWNLMEGYTWSSDFHLAETKKVLASCEEFALMDAMSSLQENENLVTEETDTTGKRGCEPLLERKDSSICKHPLFNASDVEFLNDICDTIEWVGWRLWVLMVLLQVFSIFSSTAIRCRFTKEVAEAAVVTCQDALKEVQKTRKRMAEDYVEIGKKLRDLDNLQE
ncbi:mediator complex subunit MED6 [Cardiosporidium cionae]|uniref:Mediator of RNA polymerase II transcription subunit 6 n=1 Tax=Cardiosporidium cionae TaxID=476202 RepID=A0ABQ7J4R4_9APIC|nr:mediator complex subunit MED6 [Cardiosporidium cionae]|eukprot:KAF8818379.1 mediator complex subunit MED6 [Cardiosporidium cionae]